ncbi:Rrf2 family transcriptional regulator [Leuconostoc suionicum]|uniref:Rrf2 family transcriptional regulator n=1 Tax=Leuconostoc suionicum TaxID=1511761 RepID=UPI004036ADC6
MKFSYKLSDGIHILTFLSIYKDDDLSSKKIADSIGSNASVVRGLMVDLREAGLITTHQGSATPLLSKKTTHISIYDVYIAISMDHNLLHIDPKTNPDCIVGGNIQSTLNEIYEDVEMNAYNRMKQITIANVIDGILTRHSHSNDS